MQEGTQDDYEQCANAKFKASRKYQYNDELMQSKAIGSKTSAGRDPRTYDKEPKAPIRRRKKDEVDEVKFQMKRSTQYFQPSEEITVGQHKSDK